MTKKNADAISRYLDLRCDQSYLFVTQIGTGAFSRTKVKGKVATLLTLLLKMLDDVLDSLKRDKRDSVREMILLTLINYLADDMPEPTPPKPAEELSGKEISRRIKRTERMLTELEAVL